MDFSNPAESSPDFKLGKLLLFLAFVADVIDQTLLTTENKVSRYFSNNYGHCGSKNGISG